MGQATLVGTGHTGFLGKSLYHSVVKGRRLLCIFLLMHLHAVVNAASQPQPQLFAGRARDEKVAKVCCILFAWARLPN